MSGVSRSAMAYIARARSRTCRPRRGYGRAAPGGTRGCGCWRSRAARRRAAGRRRGRRGSPGVTAVNRPSADLQPHARRRRPGSHACRAQYGCGHHGAERPARGRRWRARRRPAQAVVALGELGRRVGDAGRVADEQHGASGCRPRRARRRRDRRRWPAPAPSGSSAEMRRRRPTSNDVAGVHDSCWTAPPAVSASAVSSATTARDVSGRPRRGRRARRVTRDGTALTAFGSTLTLPTVAERRRAGGGRPPGRAGSPRPAAASGRAGRRAGWCRRGCLAGQVEQPAAVRPDRAADGDRLVGVGKPAALFDVQLDERADPARASPRPARRPWGRARRGAAPRPCVTPSTSVSPRAAVGVEQAGDQPGTGARDPEPGALLVAELDDGDRPGRARTRRRAARRARPARTPRPADRRTRRRPAPSRGGCRSPGRGCPGPAASRPGTTTPTGCRPGRRRDRGRARHSRRRTTRAGRRPRAVQA